MGNFANPLLRGSSVEQLTYHSKMLSPDSREKYIIKQIVTHSSAHHQEVLIQLSKFKQYQSSNIVRLIDSHTMQSKNLCSLVTYIYAILERPKYTLEAYLLHLNSNKEALCSKKILKMISDIIRGLVYLKQQGNELQRIRQEHIFINEDQNGELVTKIINPFFKQCEYEGEDERGVVVDLGMIFKKYIRFESHSQDLIQTITRMASSTISLEQLSQIYVNENKNGRIKLKLTKRGSSGISRYNKTSRGERDSLTSIVSNGSSLLIEGGDASGLALKEFYQNIEDEVSNSDVSNTNIFLTSYTLDQSGISHEFPKKYTKSRGFNKAGKKLGSEVSEARSDEKLNITRDQSLKQNIRIDHKPILLYSAKLVQSFISQL